MLAQIQIGTIIQWAIYSKYKNSASGHGVKRKASVFAQSSSYAYTVWQYTSWAKVRKHADYLGWIQANGQEVHIAVAMRGKDTALKTRWDFFTWT